MSACLICGSALTERRVSTLLRYCGPGCRRAAENAARAARRDAQRQRHREASGSAFGLQPFTDAHWQALIAPNGRGTPQ